MLGEEDLKGNIAFERKQILSKAVKPLFLRVGSSTKDAAAGCCLCRAVAWGKVALNVSWPWGWGHTAPLLGKSGQRVALSGFQISSGELEQPGQSLASPSQLPGMLCTTAMSSLYCSGHSQNLLVVILRQKRDPGGASKPGCRLHVH